MEPLRIFLLSISSTVLITGQSDSPQGDLVKVNSGQSQPAQTNQWVPLSRLALEQENLGHYQEAETLRRQALAEGEKALPAGDKLLAALLSNLATVLDLQRRGAEADPLARRALVIAQESGDKRLIACTLNTLGISLYEQDELARAEPVFRRAIALFEESEGGDSLDAAKAYNCLATVYCDSHQHAKAEELMTRALAIYEKRLPPGDPLLPLALDNMFLILAGQHRAVEGEPYLRRAVELGEKIFPGTVRLAKIQGGLAALAFQKGNLQEAARIFESIIPIEERELGPFSPTLAHTLANYSIVLRQLHQNAQAKRIQDRANGILKSFH